MRLTPRSIALVVLALALGYFAVVRATSDSATSGTGGTTPADLTPLAWSACTGDDAPEEPFQCATIEVPVDYGQPDGETLEVAMVRLPAEDQGSKAGIVLANPGGPGGSGFDYIANSGQTMASTLGLSRYDLIGFDPRGVDRSSPVRCQSDAEMDKYLYVDDTPDNDAEQSLYDESIDAFEKACRAKYGDGLIRFSTENAARDMDFIRAAMGEDSLNYIGISYGTYLGGVYATLFPDRVGRFYLDGALDPAGDTVEQQYTTQAEGFEKAFNNWASDCEKNTSCPFHSDDVGTRWERLYDKLDETSISSEDGREVNNAVVSTATISALYSKASWGLFAAALAEAEKGDGTGLLGLADRYNDRAEDGTFSSLMQSFPVIQCASGMGSPKPEDPEALVKKLKELAPRFARDATVEDFDERQCEGLMDDPPIIEIDYTGDAPVVVVGGKNDPATPFRWAEEMTANMGSNARLVSYTGEGHGQLLSSACVDGIARGLFAPNVALPENDTVCDPDPVVDQPAWWSELPAPAPGETVLDRSVGDGLVGLTDTQAFAEYRAVRGQRGAVYVATAARLKAAGFEPTDPGATDTAESPQFFSFGGQMLGVFVLSPDDVSKAGAPVPDGSSLIVLYFYPPED